LGAPVHGPEA